jgi:hypothetical protein
VSRSRLHALLLGGALLLAAVAVVLLPGLGLPTWLAAIPALLGFLPLVLLLQYLGQRDTVAEQLRVTALEQQQQTDRNQAPSSACSTRWPRWRMAT